MINLHGSESEPHYDLSSVSLPAHRLIIQEVADSFIELLDSYEESHRQFILSALSLAVEAHGNQAPRSEDVPYPCHPIQVARHIIETFGISDPLIIAAALLHDSLEDQSELLASKLNETAGFSEKEAAKLFLENEFGSEVAGIVSLLSNPDIPSLPAGISSEERERIKNDHYLQHVISATSREEVYVIKLADFLENGLALEGVEEPQRSKLEKKYLPVLQYFTVSLEKCSPDSLLYPRKDTLKQRLLDGERRLYGKAS